MSETDDAYLVKADAPGVPKEDIKVTVEGNFVTIEFEVDILHALKDVEDVNTAYRAAASRWLRMSMKPERRQATRTVSLN